LFNENVLLKLLPPDDVTLPDPDFVMLTGLLNVEPLNETDAELVATFTEKVVPAKITVPEQLTAPLLIEPPLKLAEPLTVSVNPFKFNVPELMVKLLRPATSVNIGLLLPDTIVTSSPTSGMPVEGDQFAALPHAEETAPVQV
jgi:hypothetical protein